MSALSPDAIRGAREGISPMFRDSPQFVHDGLSERAGIPVIVKIDGPALLIITGSNAERAIPSGS